MDTDRETRSQQMSRIHNAQAIASELEQICTKSRLVSFAESEHDELYQHRSLVQTRLGGDYDDSAWHDALELIRESHRVTDAQIRALRREAAEAGDLVQVDLCDRALTGSSEARSRCVETIVEA